MMIYTLGPPGIYAGWNVQSDAVKVYVCPSDPTNLGGFNTGPAPYTTPTAVASYGANFQVFGKFENNGNGGDSRNIFPTALADGTSNTILFADKYAYPTAKPPYYYLIHLSEYTGSWFGDEAAFAEYWPGTGTWNSPFPVTNDKFLVQPTPSYCDQFSVTDQYFTTWQNGCQLYAITPHTGVINVGLGDGSVRGVANGISATTWGYAVTPAGGEVLPSDW
jgi:hypothetical protein